MMNLFSAAFNEVKSDKNPTKTIPMRYLFNHHHQHGADFATVPLVMLFLSGLMGIGLNFDRFFIIKTELQTAMNSCALAAAKELDGQDTALVRAASAGQLAGNPNNTSAQPNTWSNKEKRIIAEITFKDSSYVATVIPANARYAQCQYTKSGIGIWLLQFIENFPDNSENYPHDKNITALAVATSMPCTSSVLTCGVIGQPVSILVR
jgi:uncharacterized membrane protein